MHRLLSLLILMGLVGMVQAQNCEELHQQYKDHKKNTKGYKAKYKIEAEEKAEYLKQQWQDCLNGKGDFTDSDGDGVIDENDYCPNEVGLKTNNGCPSESPSPDKKDSDGDGIADQDDNCPNKYGIASNSGCPADKKAVSELVMKGREAEEIGKLSGTKDWENNSYYKKAFNYYKEAALAGDAEGTAELAMCYYRGVGVAKNESKGRTLLYDALEKGSSEAVEYMEFNFSLLNQIAKKKVLNEMFAREGQSEHYAAIIATIMYNGFCYRPDGIPSIKSFGGRTFIQWLEKGVEQNSVVAYETIACYYSTENQMELAVQHWKKACELGSEQGCVKAEKHSK